MTLKKKKNLWLPFCLVVGNWSLTGNEQRFLLVSDTAALLAAALRCYRTYLVIWGRGGLSWLSEDPQNGFVLAESYVAPRKICWSVCLFLWDRGASPAGPACWSLVFRRTLLCNKQQTKFFCFGNVWKWYLMWKES